MSERYTLHRADCLKHMRSMPDRSVDLVFTSPPYEAARTYGIDFTLRGQAYVDWLAERIVEMCRVSSGIVAINVSAPKSDGIYSPAVQWLVSDLTRYHGIVMPAMEYAWVKNAGIPGSGGKQFHRRDWEPVYVFCYPDRLPLVWSDNTAFGHPPKWAPGGEMSHRLSDGTKVNQWGPKRGGSEKGVNGERRYASRPSHKQHTKRETNGDMVTQTYVPPDVANPGNVIRGQVGGGMDGSDRDGHGNEAPMPVYLAERFVCWFAPPSGVVLDPFCGSSTTGIASLKHARKFLGIDIRKSEIARSRRRLMKHTPGLFA